MNALFLGTFGGTEFLLILSMMIPGMLAIYLILKHEKGVSIPVWILVIFFIPFLGWAAYLIKYFIIEKRKSL